jgi:DNA-binding transcriptional regulator PaaX
MTKRDLLAYLAHTTEADAQDVVREFGVRYSLAAMALLRLVRQGLATRQRYVERGGYRYRLSERGQSRLAYLERGRGPHEEGDLVGTPEQASERGLK